MKVPPRPFPAFLLLSLLSFSTLLISRAHSQDGPKEYIVYMGDRLKGVSSTMALYLSMLEKVLGRAVGPDSILYSYKRSFNGFVVKLSEQQMHIMSGMEGVASVFPNLNYELQTTRSWDFIGFSQQVERASTVESDIIIGMIDTGIWPESESFSDAGFGPPPSKWKGTCQASTNFTCNNKIIGAKYYTIGPIVQIGPGDDVSPRDTIGHGTHTASTVAGNAVTTASLYGIGSGTARGGAPSARIAVYKTCWASGCSGASVLAAFDDAIADGVDIISISLGYYTPLPFFMDVIAIGAFHAMKNGILTSQAAGNGGPDVGSITSTAPWYLSVAASSIDRKFLTEVELGNGVTYQGISINTFDLANGMHPLIYGGDAPSENSTRLISRYCKHNSLDPNVVAGKIVLCDKLYNGTGPFLAGALGSIMNEDLSVDDVAWNFPLPTSYVSHVNGSSILSYISSSSNALGTIYKTVEGNDPLAPLVASFSSRGPNSVALDILKPDLAAPGLNILAAWTLATSITRIPGDKRLSPYNIISGTSMACPHASAAAAYVKSFHPRWSPAAIKSALMTTALAMSATSNREAELAYGSGQINPARAINPGLIYDADQTDYMKFLCGQGYNPVTLLLISGDVSICSDANSIEAWNLNYPSFALSTTSSQINRTFTRTVTNVGSPASVYKYTVMNAPKNLSIQVVPEVLTFTYLDQKLSFTVSIEGRMSQSLVSASLVWDDGKYQVRSPIVMYFAS